MLATLYEVPVGGAQVTVFVLILPGSLVAAVGLGAAVQNIRLDQFRSIYSMLSNNQDAVRKQDKAAR